jgi:stage V sporulation protein R
LGQKSDDIGIIEYAKHKMGVLGGKYSMNPYKLGLTLLLDIEERWNKGQFGTEWDDCDDMNKKKDWDTKAGLGKEKVFEVRKYYNDLMLISEFFTSEFCHKNEFFEWKRYPNGEYKIENKDWRSIKNKLMKKHLNGGLPDIRLTDPNHRGNGYMFLQHEWNDQLLYDPYVREVLPSLRYFWKNNVYLGTKNKDGKEIVYCCRGETSKDVDVVSRKDFIK